MPDTARRHRSNVFLVLLVIGVGILLWVRTSQYNAQAVAHNRAACKRAEAFNAFLRSDARLRRSDVLSGRGSVVLWRELGDLTQGTRAEPIYQRFAVVRAAGARASARAARYWLRLARTFRYGC